MKVCISLSWFFLFIIGIVANVADLIESELTLRQNKDFKQQETLFFLLLLFYVVEHVLKLIKRVWVKLFDD